MDPAINPTANTNRLFNPTIRGTEKVSFNEQTGALTINPPNPFTTKSNSSGAPSITSIKYSELDGGINRIKTNIQSFQFGNGADYNRGIISRPGVPIKSYDTQAMKGSTPTRPYKEESLNYGSTIDTRVSLKEIKYNGTPSNEFLKLEGIPKGTKITVNDPGGKGSYEMNFSSDENNKKSDLNFKLGVGDIALKIKADDQSINASFKSNTDGHPFKNNVWGSLKGVSTITTDSNTKIVGKDFTGAQEKVAASFLNELFRSYDPTKAPPDLSLKTSDELLRDKFQGNGDLTKAAFNDLDAVLKQDAKLPKAANTTESFTSWLFDWSPQTAP